MKSAVLNVLLGLGTAKKYCLHEVSEYIRAFPPN